MATTSGSILDRARQGDALAFQKLAERYQLPIYRYIYRLVGDVEMARHLTEDTFIIARRRLARSEDEMRFLAWLYRIATAQVTAALRRSRILSWLVPGFRKGRARQNAMSLEDDSEGRAMQQALARLPADEAISVVLRSVEGFSYEEIAYIQRSSLSAVRRRLSQGRERLRTMEHKQGERA